MIDPISAALELPGEAAIRQGEDPDQPLRLVVHVGRVRVEIFRGVPPGTPARKRPVSYLHPEHGWYAQYAGAQAGYYPGARRSARREAEVSAHQAGVRQLGRYELLQAERRGLRDALLVEAAGLDETTEETLPEDLPSATDYRIGDAEDLLGGVTALRALTCPSEISEGGTEELLSHLELVSPGEAPSALTFYLAYDSSGTRIGQPSGAAGLALSRALDELAETYRDLSELGWGEEAERQADLNAARADLHLLRVTLSGALTPAALAALTGLDSSDAEAIPRAAALLQRLQREALPSPTPAELARLMRAAVGAGRQQELAEALLAGDDTRIRYLQLALLRPGAL